MVAAALPPVIIAAPVQVVNLCAGLNGAHEGVRFHTDSAELTPDSVNTLDEVAHMLGSCADAQIEISAHTDSIGAESYNRLLSERRAHSVADYLNASGLLRGRLTTTAHGETIPVDTNDTAEGRALNRRVELYAR